MLLDGSLLVVDPASGASSDIGYSLYTNLIFQESGIIKISTGMDPDARVKQIYPCLSKEFKPVDILAIELLRGSMVPYPLWWAVGAIISAIDYKHLVEVPIPVWKAVAKITEGYEKSDVNDAMMMGESLAKLARLECAADISK
jgi:hypothetical protein